MFVYATSLQKIVFILFVDLDSTRIVCLTIGLIQIGHILSPVFMNDNVLSVLQTSFLKIPELDSLNVSHVFDVLRNFVETSEEFFKMFKILIKKSLSCVHYQHLETRQEIVISSFFVLPILSNDYPESQWRCDDNIGLIQLFVELDGPLVERNSNLKAIIDSLFRLRIKFFLKSLSVYNLLPRSFSVQFDDLVYYLMGLEFIRAQDEYFWPSISLISEILIVFFLNYSSIVVFFNNFLRDNGFLFNFP